jgi:hypothetical protein
MNKIATKTMRYGILLVIGSILTVSAQAQNQPQAQASDEAEETSPRFADVKFRSYVVDDDFPRGSISQTAIFQMDREEGLEFHIGGSAGNFIYKSHSPGRWTRYQVSEGRAPTDAGGTVMDVDGDGLGDIVAGSAWFRNTGDLNVPFERFDYDPENERVHDQLAVDINRDGRLDVLTMSDANNTRWYDIPSDPTQPWIRHDIGPAVHGGVAPKGVGDLNGDGHIDVVRTDVWFENVNGDGIQWREHRLGAFMPLPEGEPNWARDAGRAYVSDLNGDGRNDIVQSVEEIRGGRIWWNENLGTREDGSVEWRRHYIAGHDRIIGAVHSLVVEDFTGDGLPDIVVAEMDWQRARPGANGEENPRYFLWENLGIGPEWDPENANVEWKEHVIADINLGGHEIMAGDLTGDGRLDIVGKPWSPSPNNALGGRAFVIVLENLTTPKAGFGPPPEGNAAP